MEINQYTDSLINELKGLGVKKGDILYISSDVTRLTFDALRQCGLKGKKDIDKFYNALTDSIKEMVSEDGTILFPVFTWSFCRNIPFDVKTTQGEVGALNNWVLNNRSDFKRTAHPLYSFMVWGKDADKLVRMTNMTAWGKDSPFGYLYENKAKNLLIDVSLEECFTFEHFVEESLDFPIRYFKDFTGEYVTADGVNEVRTYSMFVRDLDIESSQVTPDDCLVKAGVSKMTNHRGIELQLVDLAGSYPFIVKNLKEHNADEWYDLKGYVIDWAGGRTHPDESLIYKRI